MSAVPEDKESRQTLARLASKHGLDVTGDGSSVRRTSSRFCFGVEHGDYNGTDLFGVGTDRFIWLAFKPNGTDKCRIVSNNFELEVLIYFRFLQQPSHFLSQGVKEFSADDIPSPRTEELENSWTRFPLGVYFILKREGFGVAKGFDAAVFGNIPGGGMSRHQELKHPLGKVFSSHFRNRSAALTVNLMLTVLEVNGVADLDPFKLVDLSQVTCSFDRACSHASPPPASPSPRFARPSRRTTSGRRAGSSTRS